MATYKVTIPVTLIVEVSDENPAADPIPPLSGGASIAAVRRAINYLLSGPMGLRKQLGIRRLFINGKWENVAVEPTTMDAKGIALPATVPLSEERAGEKPFLSEL